MPMTRHTPVFDQRFIRHLARLTRIYWTSPDAKKGAALLALCVAGELGNVYGQVRLALANSYVFDAVQNKQWPAFLTAIEIFLLTSVAVVFVSTYRIYVRNILQMRWRTQLTDHFLGEWMGPHAYIHRELYHKEADNPDQRISEDIQNYVASALGLSLSFLSAVATLVSFAGMLWALSGDWPLRVAGYEFYIPGLMMWVAIGYALLSTWLTHRVGRTLVSINFDKLKFEADFRYGLVRFRDHVEAVALSRGQAVEHQGALKRFKNVIVNWRDLIIKQRNLTLLTSGIGQANSIVPLLVAAPAFFAGRMTLGMVTQTQIAYGQVSGSLSWFVDAYQEIAAWRANIERLATFAEKLDDSRVELAKAGIQVEAGAEEALSLVQLDLAEPEGQVLASNLNASIQAGEHVALLGPPGLVKTTLFRAIAAIWPFGHGKIEMPAHAQSLFLPHQAYLPIGTLREAVSYPAASGTFADDTIVEALELLDLGHLAKRLDDSEPWDQELSVDEQQRLTFARAFLHRPNWLITDDATGALDEAMEKRVFETLAKRLPGTAVLSITNRPTVAQFHQRHWVIAPGGDGRDALQTS
ncbi:MAG: ABC transporter ATP-binding protein/permease [Deltaproteobacteria bacterium]|nr:ABC transporter ATP-binding protein/permease [Deltaproteobacteria bacterium]